MDRYQIGTCGELAWTQDDSPTLYFAGRDRVRREVASWGIPYWLEGDHLLFRSTTEWTLVTPQGERTWPAGAWDSRQANKLDGDAFWICSKENGIERLDDDGVHRLTPDFLSIPESVGCRSIEATPSGAIAYVTEANRIGLVNTRTGFRQVIDHPFYPEGTYDEEGRERSDPMHLSADGTVLLHGEKWTNQDGWPVREGLTVFQRGNEAIRFSGGLGRGKNGGAWGPWMGTAPGIFIPHAGEQAHLVGLGDPIPFGRMQPLEIRGNHLFVYSGDDVALLELDSGKLHRLFDAGSSATVFPFRWGGAVAFYYLQCASREAEIGCQEWAVVISSWTAERGNFELFQGPMLVHAIGRDGSLIASEWTAEEPGLKQDSLLHFGGDGKLIRQLDLGAGIVGGMGGEHFAVLERMRGEDEARREELVAVDWLTGEETLLVRGASIMWWELDHSDRLLTALVVPGGDAASVELWSGVVLR